MSANMQTLVHLSLILPYTLFKHVETEISMSQGPRTVDKPQIQSSSEEGTIENKL